MFTLGSALASYDAHSQNLTGPTPKAILAVAEKSPTQSRFWKLSSMGGGGAGGGGLGIPPMGTHSHTKCECVSYLGLLL